MTTFHRTTRIPFVVVLLAAGTAPIMRAQTALQAQVSLRPLTARDVTDYKLPSTSQRSAGLSTIGLGQPAYLEAQVNIAIPAEDIAGVTWALASRPATSKAELADSPLGESVPIFEPSNRLAARVAGRKLLRPDVVGLYTVKATIATTSGGTAEVGQSIIGATYVGIQRCAACHSGAVGSDKVTPWSKTKHANIFKDGMNGVASDHYGANCLRCHTVGYDADPSALNGGFDDVATQLKWVFPTVQKAGTYEALPDALKNVGNIQCENCHGPGSQHAMTGSRILISVSLGSGVCAQCHASGTNHIKSTEWVGSLHSAATSYPSGAGREGCVGCHTGPGFIGTMKGAATLSTAYGAINCQTCHESHGRTTPATNKLLLRNLTPVKLMDGTVLDKAGYGAVCMNCHQSRQNAATYVTTTVGSARFGPHYSPQADMLAGVNGFNYGRYIPSSAHAAVVEDTCAHCHMQPITDTKDPAFLKAGGHTFKMALQASDKNPVVYQVEACYKCHGPNTSLFDFQLFDYDNDGSIDGVQTEIQHLLDKLALQLPPAGKPKTELAIDSTWTRPQLAAAYNWQFVKYDGSFGIHNTAYAVGLLKASIADLATQK
ncbi:MAG: multiheme c-type cytochrome [Bryobacterales bacterium]|nr:multiheme c-type cytochrome [Bryobacterales bacterium]